MKGILYLSVFFTVVHISYAQTYNGELLKAGSTTNTGLPYIINNTQTVIFEAVEEIVIGPDCSTPPCTASDNYFYTSGFDNSSSNTNYFLARLVSLTLYAELKYELDETYYVTQNKKLYFKFIEKYQDGVLSYQIYDYQRSAKVPVGTQVLTKQIGTNFLSVDVSTLGLVATGELDSYYTLEVTNAKGEKSILRFKYVIEPN